MSRLSEIAAIADLATRAVALGVAAVAATIAATHWAIRQKYLSPFGPWPRTVRSLADPFLRPLERRIARRGGNPQDASLWLVGITVVLGLLLVNGVRWGFDLAYAVGSLADASPRTWARVVVGWIFSLLILALFVRFISGWLGISPYARWMRPVVIATDWLVIPIRRIVPPVGLFDLSPVVAYLVLVLLQAFVDRVIFR